jgi:hypothetical protein
MLFREQAGHFVRVGVIAKVSCVSDTAQYGTVNKQNIAMHFMLQVTCVSELGLRNADL